MGRRAYKKVTTNGSVTLHQRYLYRGYLQIACVDLTRAAHPALWYITWDPTQPVATRPLAIQINGTWHSYGIDLTKNICELYGTNGSISRSYTYTPFGQVTTSGSVSQPIQWSSEVWDSELGLVYYNWRYYNTISGNWNSKYMEENVNLYMYSKSPISTYDILGLKISICKQAVDDFEEKYKIKTSHRIENGRMILFGIKRAKSNTSITDEIIEKMIKSQEIYEIKGGNSRLALQNLANHIDSRKTTVLLADMYKIPFPSEDNNYKESDIKLYYKALGNKQRRNDRIQTFKKWNEQKQDKITYACLNAVSVIMRTASHEKTQK